MAPASQTRSCFYRPVRPKNLFDCGEIRHAGISKSFATPTALETSCGLRERAERAKSAAGVARLATLSKRFAHRKLIAYEAVVSVEISQWALCSLALNKRNRTDQQQSREAEQAGVLVGVL